MYYDTAPEMLHMTYKTDQHKKQKDSIQLKKIVQQTHQSKQK